MLRTFRNSFGRSHATVKVDEVVHHVVCPEVPFRVHEGLPILEDHQARFGRCRVLGRHVHPVGMLRARIGLARQRERPLDLTLRYSGSRERVRAELIMDVGVRCLRLRRLSGERSRREAGNGDRRCQNKCSIHEVSPEREPTTGSRGAELAALTEGNARSLNRPAVGSVWKRQSI